MKQSGKKKEEIKGYQITVKTNPEIEKIVEGELTKELQEELRIGGKFNPDDPNLPQKIKERIEETRELGYEIPYFYDSVTGKIFINENSDSEEVRAKIAREWAIRRELEAGKGKENDEGREKATVSGIIAFNEVRDRTKNKGNGIDVSILEYGEFDPNSEITSDGTKKVTIETLQVLNTIKSQLPTSVKSLIDSIDLIKSLSSWHYRDKIKNNNYNIIDEKLSNELIKLSLSTDYSLPSKYFGIYFLDKNTQNRYLEKDKDVNKSIDKRGELRFDKLDKKGYENLIKSKEYESITKKSEKEMWKTTYENIKNVSTIDKIIENKNVYEIFAENIEIIKDPGGLPITLRTATMRSNTILKAGETNKGYQLEITREYKLYDEFKEPYNVKVIDKKIVDIVFHSKKETGNPYSMSDGYRRSRTERYTFKNRDEAIRFIRDRMK